VRKKRKERERERDVKIIAKAIEEKEIGI